MLTIVEKVIFLQEVDIFQYTSSEDLSHVAAVVQEVTHEPEVDIYVEGTVADSMYMVIDGKVKLHREGKEVMTAGYKDVFGTWSLFDDEPRIVTATTLETSRLLRLDREDFIDLLADHIELTESILKAIATRLRSLVGRVE